VNLVILFDKRLRCAEKGKEPLV